MMITHKKPPVLLQITADTVIDTQVATDVWNSATDEERGELVSQHCAFSCDVAILTHGATAAGISACEASNPISLGIEQLTRLAVALNYMEKEALLDSGKIFGTGKDISSDRDISELRRLWASVQAAARECGL